MVQLPGRLTVQSFVNIILKMEDILTELHGTKYFSKINLIES